MLGRRSFLQVLGVTAGAGGLTACGGGAAASAMDPAHPQGPNGGSGGVGSTTPPPPVAAPNLAAVKLRAATAGRHPFAFGHPFRPGDVPRGQELAGLQLSALSHWPDGSVRFGVVAGDADFGPSVRSFDLKAAAPTSEPALLTSHLRATGLVVEVTAAAIGTAAWQGADWDAPDRVWLTGSRMSSWLYRRSLAVGTHLVAWIEVRLWAGGQVEILPWIENGYVLLPGAVSRKAKFALAVDGAVRFEREVDLPSRCRTPLVDGSRLSHWRSDDHLVEVRHDALYLMSTGVVPFYGQPVPDTAIPTRPASFVPLELGQYSPSMGTGGYHPSIGLLPSWDALILTNQTSAAPWYEIQRQAYRAGRFGIHFRDERTQRPARLSDWSTAVFGRGTNIGDVGSTDGVYSSAGSGTPPARFQTSHHPSMGFMAALLTGRCYHVETVQFVAAINSLLQSPQYRGGGSGALRPNTFIQPRGFAWALRTLAQAVVVTPDDDPLRNEFTLQIRATVLTNHARYVARQNNPQGFMETNLPGMSDYSQGADPYHAGVWMLDFCTAAVGYLIDCVGGLGPDDAALTAWFHWMARSVVGRFGGEGPEQYLYRDAAQYTLATAPKDGSDWNGGGPWYRTWGDVWAATVDRSRLAKVIGDGSLREGFIGNVGSYWANLTPALAYAVRHEVADARQAWLTFTSAPNFATGVAATFRLSPEWGVYPRPNSAP